MRAYQKGGYNFVFVARVNDCRVDIYGEMACNATQCNGERFVGSGGEEPQSF